MAAQGKVILRRGDVEHMVRLGSTTSPLARAGEERLRTTASRRSDAAQQRKVSERPRGPGPRSTEG